MTIDQTATGITGSTNSAVATIAKATIIAGALDAAAGVLIYWIYKGLNPFRVLQYIASGVFGPSVINGGFIYVPIGLVFHFVIAFAFTYAYFLAFRFIKSFAKNTWLNGLIYGAFIWFFMNYLVLPYSNIPQSPKDFVSVLELIWHSALVGLPVALVVEKYFKNYPENTLAC